MDDGHEKYDALKKQENCTLPYFFTFQLVFVYTTEFEPTDVDAPDVEATDDETIEAETTHLEVTDDETTEGETTEHCVFMRP